ncbi:MAG: hypothetical protein B7Y99_06925 [Caulobacterales bacterium 32-69-10]|nr:MAG: hypothetical protein B7Y99_06925 [Caulobacterales bacterium 32-69-10]
MAGKTIVKTETSERRQALVVAGMHRSGTSAMARLLSLSGAALPERVMDPGPDNPLGYWEPWEMVALDDEILAAIDSRWDDVFALKGNQRALASRTAFLGKAQDFLTHNFGSRDLPVMKDPRSSVLTGFWREALDQSGLDPTYVIMVRHPLEVADSLLVRNGFPREKSLLLWASYMLAVERDTRGASRLFVSYSDMLGDWRGVLDRVEKTLGRPLPRRTPAAGVEIERFLSKSHRHHEAGGEAFDALGADWAGVRAVYDWMSGAARGAESDEKALDKVERELTGVERVFGPVLAEAMLNELGQRKSLAQATEALEAVTFHREALLVEVDAAKAQFSQFHAEADGKAQELQAEILGAKDLIAELRAELETAQGAYELEQASHQATRHLLQGEIAKIDILSQQLTEVRNQFRQTDTASRDDRIARREAEAEAASQAAKVEILTQQLAAAMAWEPVALNAQATAAVLDEHIKNLTLDREALLASTSWQLTRPLRAVMRRIRR